MFKIHLFAVTLINLKPNTLLFFMHAFLEIQQDWYLFLFPSYFRATNKFSFNL